MKKLIEKFKNNRPQAILGIFTFALVGAFILTRIFAAGANVSLSSSATTVAKGETFEVTVLASTGTTEVTIGQAYVVYDPAKLEYVSSDVSSSAFDTKSPDDSAGSGYIKLSRFKFPPPPYPSGEIELGKITFRMLADNGSVDIGVEGAATDKTYLASAEDASNIVTSTSGVTVNVENENPQPAPVTVGASLSADRSTMKKDETVKITYTINAGSNDISVGKGQITFDPNQFVFVSRDYTGSSLPTTMSSEEKEGSGFVSIARYGTPPFPTGDVVVGSVTLRAIAEGNASIGIDNTNSEIYVGSTGQLATVNGSGTNVAIVSQGAYEPTPVAVSATLTPDKTTIAKDETVKITYTINAGSNDISVGKGYITFNPAEFEFVSRDYTGSELDTSVTNEETDGPGFATLARYTAPPFPSGNVVVGSVVLKALASNAAATISVDSSNSEVYIGSTGQEATLNGGNTNVTISTATEPDPVCEDAAANNTGGALPCTYDPTPPPVVVPVTPGGGGGSIPTVPKGTTVIPQAPKTTSTGQTITSTDYYLNGEYQGTSTGAENPVEINTQNLAPGTYDITARSTAKDGSTEEATQSFKVRDDAILVKYRLPIVLAASSVLAVVVGIILKSLFSSAIPFYRTLK